MSNYIFFEDEDSIDAPVYRVFSVERLLQLFSSKSIVLVKPAKWDDPFENFILKSEVKFANGEKATIEFSNYIFGQCWSLKAESDAMWRIYSPDKHGVKVRSTPRKLLDALSNNVENPDISAFVGKVRYEGLNYLREMVTDRVRMKEKVFDSTGRGHAETLLFKRTEFSHEEEVRIIYSGNKEQSNSDLFKFAVNPLTIIDEIMFDPRMDKHLADIYRDYFLAQGFGGTISQSILYEVPGLIISV